MFCIEKPETVNSNWTQRLRTRASKPIGAFCPTHALNHVRDLVVRLLDTEENNQVRKSKLKTDVYPCHCYCTQTISNWFLKDRLRSSTLVIANTQTRSLFILLYVSWRFLKLILPIGIGSWLWCSRNDKNILEWIFGNRFYKHNIPLHVENVPFKLSKLYCRAVKQMHR